jgi:hypothetical protein
MDTNRLNPPAFVAVTDTGEYILDGDGLAELALVVAIFHQPETGDVWFSDGTGRRIAVLHEGRLVRVD